MSLFKDKATDYNYNQRKSNIDLLRGLCAIFVIFEHFCEPIFHNAFGYAQDSSVTAYILLRLLYAVARTAVPVFFLLSGYLSIYSKNQKLGKAINLFIMTGAYSLLNYLASCFWGYLNGERILSVEKLLFNGFPRHYYVYLFCALYAFSPFLNIALNNLGKRQYYHLCIILFSVFSLWSTFINSVCYIFGKNEMVGWYFTSRTGTSMGFNIANFTMLYIIGGYLRKFYKPVFKRDSIMAIMVCCCSCFIVTVGIMLYPAFSTVSYNYYDSIFVIISAIAITIIFLNIRISNSKILSFIGTHTFGTFLLHGFITAVLEKIVTVQSVVSKGFLGAVLGVLIFVLGVYVLALFSTAILERSVYRINVIWKKTRLYNYKFFPDDNS